MTQNGYPLPEDIETAAAAWFSRTRSGALSEIDEIALEDWLEQDPAHRSAYDSVELAWNALELVRMHPRVLAMRDALPARRPFRLRDHLPPRARAVAASLAACVLGVVAIGSWNTLRTPEAPPPPPSLYESQVYRTGADERAVIALPDGSEVMLNGGGSLRTIPDGGRRLLRLERGQAFFRVAKDAAHPFIVQAGGRTITAVGTAFDVSVEPGKFAIVLVEGRVRIQSQGLAAPGARPSGSTPNALVATEMVAGSQLAAGPQGWSVTRANLGDATGWTREQLVFEAEPLADVVEQMNRRSPRKIVVLDPSVGRTLISGNFRPGDVAGFVSALEAYDYASVASRDDGSIALSAP